jgi:exopolyphosphatase/guanosine-5'-triphosphate,3'-diphosphate pyrophosphatase
MRRTLASLDIGSNSCLCLIVEEVAPGLFSVVTDELRVTGLGRGLTPAGLHPAARARTLETLRSYRELMTRHQVREVHAAGTAAMRDAADGVRLAREIRDELHIPVEIISGEREADLTFLAVAEAFKRPHPIAVIDIGGRSTELMHGRGTRPAERVSLPLGSVAGTEGFLEGDPVTSDSVERLRAHIRQRLAAVTPPRPGLELFGVAATVTSFGAMAFQLADPRPALIHGAVLTRDTLDRLLSELIARPVARRAELAGLDPRRADVIVAGGLILRESLDHFGVDRLTISDHGLRHGLLYEAYPGVVIQDPRV